MKIQRPRALERGRAPLARAALAEAFTFAVASLLFSGTFSSFPHIRFIFAHAGGYVPMIQGRLHTYAPPNIADVAPNGIDHELRRLYYDIAGTAHRPAVAALSRLVPATQILFGSDHPFVPLRETAEGMMRLDFATTDIQSIGWDNATALLPELGCRRAANAQGEQADTSTGVGG